MIIKSVKNFNSGSGQEHAVLDFFKALSSDTMTADIIAKFYTHVETLFYASELCCCDSCCCRLIRYGHAKRTVRFGEFTFTITIRIYRCPKCHHVHRFLVAEIFVPGSTISAPDADLIAESAVHHSVLDTSLLSTSITASSAYRLRQRFGRIFSSVLSQFSGSVLSLIEALLKINNHTNILPYSLFTHRHLGY